MPDVTVKFTVTRNDEEIELDVTGTIEPGENPVYDGPPDRWSAGSPSSVVIHTILLNNNKWSKELTMAEYAEAEGLLLKEHEYEIGDIYDDEPESDDFDEHSEVDWEVKE